MCIFVLNLYNNNMYIDRDHEWKALTEVFNKLKEYKDLHPSNTVILNVSPDYSSTVSMHVAHHLSCDGEMLNMIPVDVAYPDEDNSKYWKKFTAQITKLLPYKNVILVEAGVITGKNYRYMTEELNLAGYNPITIALFENKHSEFKCDIVGEYYDSEEQELEFYYEEYNKHWEQPSPLKYKLVRERDNKTFNCDNIKWVEWNEKGTAKTLHDEVEEGRSLLLDPQYGYSYTWLTTEVVEILEQTPTTIRFKTKNSVYTLSIKLT